MTSFYHLPPALDSSRKLPKNITFSPNPAVPSPTRTLYKGKENNPTITLTAYNYPLPGFEPPTGLAGPTSSSKRSTDDIHPFAEHNASRFERRLLPGACGSAEDQRTDLAQLRRDLEEHWVGLKREFEATTGRKWVPLRGWGRDEEWDWGGEDDVEMGGDGEGAVDWLRKG